MKAVSVLVILVILIPISGFGKNFNVNVTQSSVTWTGKKLTGEHNGTINLKEGVINVKKGKITGGRFEMDMNSIDNNDLTGGMKDRLVRHLKSDDFFSVASHPVSTMVLTSVTQIAGDSYKFIGDLTIKGITHPVEFSGKAESRNSGLNVNGKIVVDRSLFNVRYGSGKFFENLGNRAINDEFILDFTVVAEPE